MMYVNPLLHNFKVEILWKPVHMSTTSMNHHLKQTDYIHLFIQVFVIHIVTINTEQWHYCSLGLSPLLSLSSLCLQTLIHLMIYYHTFSVDLVVGKQIVSYSLNHISQQKFTHVYDFIHLHAWELLLLAASSILLFVKFLIWSFCMWRMCWVMVLVFRQL